MLLLRSPERALRGGVRARGVSCAFHPGGTIRIFANSVPITTDLYVDCLGIALLRNHRNFIDGRTLAIRYANFIRAYTVFQMEFPHSLVVIRVDIRSDLARLLRDARELLGILDRLCLVVAKSFEHACFFPEHRDAVRMPKFSARIVTYGKWEHGDLVPFWCIDHKGLFGVYRNQRTDVHVLRGNPGESLG